MCLKDHNCSYALLALKGRRMPEELQVPSFLLPVIEVFSVVVVVKLIATGGSTKEM